MNSHAHAIARRFFTIGPHAGAHEAASRAAASVAVPLVLLYLIGRTDLSLYAALGAFTAVYGRYASYADRIAMQVLAGGVIVAAMLAGTLLSVVDAPATFRVLVVALIAGSVTYLADVLGWRPTGAMFAVFASGACASIPATGRSFAEVLLVGGGTVAISILITATLALRRVGLRDLVAIPVIVDPGPAGRRNALAVTIGAFLAGYAGLLLIGDHWYWATVATLATLNGPDFHARITRGLQRLIGTIVGVVFAGGLLALDLPLLATIGVAIAFQGLVELVIMRNYGAAMLFITTIALVMVHMASPQPVGELIANRILETLIGVVVGLGVVFALR
ncbi:MAG: FUSC family protein, partial [Thermomicrobiales bacterium]